MKSYFALLRVRPQFRHLWLAQVISLTGDWFNTIASVVIVNRFSDSGLAVGGLFLARALPPFLVGPVAGVAADRFSRKAVLITTDLLRALIVLGFLLVNSADTLWLIYALSIAQFVVSAFFEPARAAIVPSLVQENELLAANTLASITWSAMLTLGAALGGIIAAIFGAQVALAIDSLSFLISALLITRITVSTRPAAARVQGNGWTDFVDGLRYVRQHPGIAWITLVKAMGQIGSFDIIGAVYAERVFRVGQDGALTFGLMLTFHGVGAVLGPLIGNALGVRNARTLYRAISAGFLLIPLGWLIIGVAPTLPLVLIGSMLRGMGGSSNWTYSDVLLQMKVPGQFLGRVFALDFAIFMLAMSASVWLGGLALDQFTLDPRALVLIFAAGSIGPLLMWLAITRRREAARAGSVSVQVDV